MACPTVLTPVPAGSRAAGLLERRPEVVAGVDVAAVAFRVVPLRDPARGEGGRDDPATSLARAHIAVERFEIPPRVGGLGERRVVGDELVVRVVDEIALA